MPETLPKIKASYSCEDETFSPENSKDYLLFIQLGQDAISFLVLDSVRNKFILLKVFPLARAYAELQFNEQINEVFQQNEWLDKSFKAVHISFVNAKYTLIPAALYQKEKEHNYLEFNQTLEPTDTISSDFIKNGDAYAVFGMPKALFELLNNKFPLFKLHHFVSSLIDLVLSQYKNQNKRKVVVHVQASHFDVLVTEGRKLLFFNTFQHQTSEDFIYYLLFVCEQLEMNPEELDLVLLGEIEKNSALYQILYKYIRNIAFGSRNENHLYCNKLDTLPAHFYYSIFSQTLANH
jgi:hypothetical protein